MTERGLLSVVLAVVASAMLAAGCVPQDHGWTSLYKPAQERKIRVTMPRNAPSISQQFLFTTHDAKHIGIDVIGKVGTPVIAVADGWVRDSYFEPAYGNRIEIDHGSDVRGRRTVTVYKHLKDRLVSDGAWVARGQQIASLGTTGMLGGGIPHLHFELYRQQGSQGETPTDPHLFWADGVGRVTCFDALATYPSGDFRMTYPVPCR
ncbi:MAG: M23 family metallopeptidase [Hoeflea sp.]|uniref:M23 family metallopeptidase n=1 Tax=Hoeflea sp. TaxID=1940281 RepID=UPI00272FC22A|nr:M23 family metallopeptidase [Hoeflea sp.]MDP2120443.1 M23 family metallopeptidase [Hoeflea sp.]